VTPRCKPPRAAARPPPDGSEKRRDVCQPTGGTFAYTVLRGGIAKEATAADGVMRGAAAAESGCSNFQNFLNIGDSAGGGQAIPWGRKGQKGCYCPSKWPTVAKAAQLNVGQSVRRGLRGLQAFSVLFVALSTYRLMRTGPDSTAQWLQRPLPRHGCGAQSDDALDRGQALAETSNSEDDAIARFRAAGSRDE
jgi:hypothetical protein